MRQSGSPGVAHRAWLIGRGSSSVATCGRGHGRGRGCGRGVAEHGRSRSFRLTNENARVTERCSDEPGWLINVLKDATGD